MLDSGCLKFKLIFLPGKWCLLTIHQFSVFLLIAVNLSFLLWLQRENFLGGGALLFWPSF
jgi:hypothetical protein